MFNDIDDWKREIKTYGMSDQFVDKLLEIVYKLQSAGVENEAIIDNLEHWYSDIVQS